MRLQIIDGPDGTAFGGQSQDTLAVLDVLRPARRRKPNEGMNGGQAGVSRGDAILPVRFEVIQKGQDLVGAHVIER
jgi:hypothetical protein